MANFLIIAKQGLSNASKAFEQSILEDFIELTFEKMLDFFEVKRTKC